MKKAGVIVFILLAAAIVISGCTTTEHRVEEGLAELPERSLEDKPRIAVLPFRNDSGKQIVQHGERVSQRVRSNLIETERFRVKPEEDTMQVLSEASLPNIGPGEALRVAQKLDVSYIVMGNIIEVDIVEKAEITEVDVGIEVQILDLVEQEVDSVIQGQGYASEKATGQEAVRDLIWTSREEAAIQVVNQLGARY